MADFDVTKTDEAPSSVGIRPPAALYRTLRAEPRTLATAVGATILFAAVVAVPAVLLPNPLFQRMVPTRWWDFALLAAAAPLAGLAFALVRRRGCPLPGRMAVGGVATYLAVACPTCNAIVVAALGASGALTFFAPVQPLLGLAGIAVLGFLVRRETVALVDAPSPSRAEQARSADTP